MQAICYVWAISVATGIAAKTVAAENSEKRNRVYSILRVNSTVFSAGASRDGRTGK